MAIIVLSPVETPSTPMPHQLRPATDHDSPGIITLIARCYADYPPNVLDVDNEEPELRTPATSFDGFWVIELDQQIVGSIAATRYPDKIELKKYYVHPRLRGSGQGRELHDIFLDYVRQQGVHKIVLWTDTRFDLGHKVYTHLGYRPTGQSRELHDISQTTELEFAMTLD